MATREIEYDADGRPLKSGDDGIQHGIDDNPHDDPKKGAALGGVGGAATGAAAGSMLGPAGAVVGAVVGGVAGAAASGAAVGAVDKRDNDNTISGMGDGVTPDKHPANDPVAGTTPDGVGPVASGFVTMNRAPALMNRMACVMASNEY